MLSDHHFGGHPPIFFGRRPARAWTVSLLIVVGLIVGVLLSGCTDGASPPTGHSPQPVPAVYATAAECASCHPDHYADWEQSMHAQGGDDPFLLALTELAAAENGDDGCLKCHAPSNRRHNLLSGRDPRAPGQLLREGITCDVCHSMADVPPVASLDFMDDIDPDGPKYGSLVDPVYTPAHASETRSFFSSSVVCAPCHQVNEAGGSAIENTFMEWEGSILAGMGIECQTCHMPVYTGRAATDGPIRDNLHRHELAGVDYAYGSPPGVDVARQKESIRALLTESVTVTTDVPTSAGTGGSFDLSVTVINDLTGHSIPSGVSFVREMWMEVSVRDAAGGLVYRSGWLQPNGDVVTPEEDPDLTRFASQMYDHDGEPTLFSWRAESIDDSGLLRHLDSRTSRYTIPVLPGATGPLTVDMALHFRPMMPVIARALDLEELLPIEIFDMWTDSIQVNVID